MTQDDFASRYQLLQQVGQGQVESHHALASTGVVVMAHFLPQDAALRDPLLTRLERLPRAPEGRVMEITESHGRTVVVTKFILDFQSLEAWIPEAEAEAGLASGAADAPPQPPDGLPEFEGQSSAGTDAPDSGDTPGEFTQLFRRPDVPELESDSAAAQPPPEPEAPPSPPPAPEEPPSPARAEDTSPAPSEDASATTSDDAPPEPGEFTQLFKAATPPPDPSREDSSSGDAAQASPPAPPEPPAAPSRDPEPQDSSTPEPAEPPPPPPPPPDMGPPEAPSAPGAPSAPETASGPGTPSTPEPPSTPQTPAATGRPTPPAPPSDTGQFTREMQRKQASPPPGAPPEPRLGEVPQSPPPPPPPAGDSPQGTPSFRSPLENGPAAQGPGNRMDADQVGSTPTPNLPSQQGPSDFTRVVKGMDSGQNPPGAPGAGLSGPPGPTPTPPSNPAGGLDGAPASGGSVWPFVVGLLAVVLVAGGLILFFALWGPD